MSPQRHALKGLETVRLLDADPAFGSALPAEEREAARQALVVPAQRLREGDWLPDRSPAPPGHLGLLILEGLMTREMAIAKARGIELLGAGDLLRPWQEDAVSFAEARWRVLEPIFVAELDPSSAAVMGRFPPLLGSLVDRVMQRCRSLAVHAAIGSLTGLESRLVALFWHLAERWGRRTENGVEVPLLLTHQILAELIGARRPSVTVALGRLADQDLLIRAEPGRWLLRGEPPGTGFVPAVAPPLQASR